MTKGAAIVTGGAGGIGRAVLARLAADGFIPVSWDLSTDAPTAKLAIAVDVTDAAALQVAASRTIAEAGPIRAVVINAGILGPVARAWEVSPADLRRVIETNLVSAFLTAQVTVPHLLANPPGPDRGRLVLISSVQAKEGTALSGPYAAAKAGMIALTKVLGKELAAEGVLVNAITPTDSFNQGLRRRVDALCDELAALLEENPGLLHDRAKPAAGPAGVIAAAANRVEGAATHSSAMDLLARIPMNRFLDAEEVAEMVAFLCGPGCSFSTGAVFDLSGGRSTY